MSPKRKCHPAVLELCCALPALAIMGVAAGEGAIPPLLEQLGTAKSGRSVEFASLVCDETLTASAQPFEVAPEAPSNLVRSHARSGTAQKRAGNDSQRADEARLARRYRLQGGGLTYVARGDK